MSGMVPAFHPLESVPPLNGSTRSSSVRLTLISAFFGPSCRVGADQSPRVGVGVDDLRIGLLAPGVVRSRPGRGGFQAGIAATFVAHIVRVLVRDVARRVDASGFRPARRSGSGHTCDINGPLHPSGTDPLQRTQRDEVLALHIRRCGRHGGVAPRVRDGFVDDIVRTRQTQDLCAASGCRP